jgi:hypothetical protein
MPTSKYHNCTVQVRDGQSGMTKNINISTDFVKLLAAYVKKYEKAKLSAKD